MASVMKSTPNTVKAPARKKAVKPALPPVFAKKPAPKPVKKLMPARPGRADMPLQGKLKPMPAKRGEAPLKDRMKPMPFRPGSAKPARKPMISRRSGF